MGIQLDEHDKRMISKVAELSREGKPVYAYLFGILSSSVDLFVAGHSQARDLESMWASVKLIERLHYLCNPEQLDEIASGTREIPGEDVSSGQ